MSSQDDPGASVAYDHNLQRSPHWPAFCSKIIQSQLASWRMKFPKFDELYGQVHWEGHHEIAFHIGAMLGLGYIELDARNIVVIPRAPVDLHLFGGHYDDFKSFNINVRAFLKKWGGELWGGTGSFMLTPEAEAAIKADSEWQVGHLHRPRPFSLWTQHEKNAAIHLIETRLPLSHHEPVAA